MQGYYQQIKFANRPIYIAWTTIGLCYVGSFIEDESHLQQWVTKMLPKIKFSQSNEQTIYEQQLGEYERGQRENFTFPLHLVGTPFQKQVWEALLQIPYKETTTYASIAHSIQNPKAVRAVGGAIGRNPLTIVIPCHRVIGKNGTLTGFRGGLDMKKILLTLENDQIIVK